VKFDKGEEKEKDRAGLPWLKDDITREKERRSTDCRGGRCCRHEKTYCVVRQHRRGKKVDWKGGGGNVQEGKLEGRSLSKQQREGGFSSVCYIESLIGGEIGARVLSDYGKVGTNDNRAAKSERFLFLGMETS